VLLTAEQGMGDAIQIVRHAPLLAEKDVRVVLEVRARCCGRSPEFVGSST
jgi:hypothetical protein